MNNPNVDSIMVDEHYINSVVFWIFRRGYWFLEGKSKHDKSEIDDLNYLL